MACRWGRLQALAVGPSSSIVVAACCLIPLAPLLASSTADPWRLMGPLFRPDPHRRPRRPRRRRRPSLARRRPCRAWRFGGHLNVWIKLSFVYEHSLVSVSFGLA